MIHHRIEKLKEKHLSDFPLLRRDHGHSMRTLCTDFYAHYVPDPEHCITADFLACFAEQFPLSIGENELFVGTMWHWQARIVPPIEDHIFCTNIGHYIADYEMLLREGFPGLWQKAESLHPENDTEAYNKRAFLTSLAALRRYMERYAAEAYRMAEKSQDSSTKESLAEVGEICQELLREPPKTFRQALQWIWFVYIFMETECCNAAVSFGRMDRYLSPFYLRDKEAGILCEDSALELLMAFYIKVSEGDESSMLTLGGDGIEPAFTVLFFKAQTILQMRQPSLSLRVTETLSPTVLEAAEQLTLTGCGMPAYFNDKQVTEGLLKLGIDEESTADYGIVGCYEAAPQGSYSNTTSSTCFLYDHFYEFLKTSPEYPDFDSFYEAYKAYFARYYRESLLPSLQKRLEAMMACHSPFAGCCLRGALERGLFPEQLGCDITLFGLNILGIGLLIDCLYTVKKLVFEEQFTTVKALFEAAEHNFENRTLYSKVCALQGCYGSDATESNFLAKDLSAHIGCVIAENPLHEKVILAPALFWFLADVRHRNYRTTINGRLAGELLSYGIMPCNTPHKNPTTALLNAASQIQSLDFPNGCPLMLHLDPKDTVRQEHLLLSLLKTYFASGGWHIAFDLADAALLREAQKDPSRYGDLMIKISGFSTAFVSLDKAMQDALIERAERGI